MNFIKRVIRKVLRPTYRIFVKPFLRYFWKLVLKQRMFNMFMLEALEKGYLLPNTSNTPFPVNNHEFIKEKAYIENLRFLLSERLGQQDIKDN